MCAWLCVRLSFDDINESSDVTHLSLCILVCTHVPFCVIEYMCAYACLCTRVPVYRHTFICFSLCAYVHLCVPCWAYVD